MPKKEDIVLNYRPELVKTMKNHMDVVLAVYRLNPISTLYSFLSKLYKDKGEQETANLLKEASDCVSKGNYWDWERFERDYKEPLNKIAYDLGDISEANAASFVFDNYKEIIEQAKNKTLESTNDLTKSEKYMVERFYKILSSPTRNPNIKVQEGKSKCYYDEHKLDSSFSEDLKISIDFINKECESILNIFNTSDLEYTLDTNRKENGNMVLENNVLMKVEDKDIVNGKFVVPDFVTKIGDKAFSHCKSLEEVVIPKSVIEIGNEAFYRCAWLREIHLPSNVKTIGEWAFSGCTSLKEIAIPNNVVEIKIGTFEKCASLRNVFIENKETTIGKYAFADCENLEKIDIPSKEIYVGWDSFSKCHNLNLFQYNIKDISTKVHNTNENKLENEDINEDLER